MLVVESGEQLVCFVREFVDDTVLMVESGEQLVCFVKEFSLICEGKKLRVNGKIKQDCSCKKKKKGCTLGRSCDDWRVD